MLRKRVNAILLIVVLLAGTLYFGKNGLEQNNPEEAKRLLDFRDSLVVWYTDEALTDYMNAAAVEYGKKHTDRMIPVLKSGTGLVEQINDASVHDTETSPDLCVISNESLEKAFLAGVASTVKDANGILNQDYFSDAARAAVTYKDRMVAYPFYFETTAFLYNKTYLRDFAMNQLMAQEGQEEADQAKEEGIEPVNTDVAVSEEEVETMVNDLLPGTITALEEFADAYDAPAEVEGIFKWDVSDILYNYSFSGESLNLGGINGDDPAQMSVDSPETVQCLKVFQELNQFFSIDVNAVDYNSVLQDFIDGKIVFSVVGTDAVGILEQARAEGRLPFEYGLMMMPDLSDTLKSKSRSITSTLIVNGYSENKDKAEKLAAFLVKDYAENLYKRTGKVPSCMERMDDVPMLKAYYEEYAESKPLPKLMTIGDFWIHMEIAFTKIWNGADVEEEMKLLSQYVE